MIIWRCDIQSDIKMGGGGKGGGSSNTTTSTTAPPAWLNSAYQSLVSQAQNVAATPYQNYSGQLVAPLNTNQNTAINTTANAQGMTQPYTNVASSDITAGSQAIYPQLQQFNSQNLQQYMDPNTQNVMNTTMAQLNQNDATQQSQLTGQAIQSGASPFGGDRAGVAAAALAGQQDMANNSTMAGLESQNYTQALNELNNQQQLQANTESSDAWRQLSGGQEESQLGTTAQNNTLNQANAQLIAGGTQQQEAQENLNVPYEEWQAQQAYPFQTTDYLAGIESGVGSAAGGTGTTTSPGPSTASELGGLGLTGLGIYGMTGGFAPAAAAAKTGGRIAYRNGGVTGRGHYDIGGVTLPSIPSITSYVPSVQMNGHANLPQAPKPQTQQSPSALSSLTQGLQLGKLLKPSGGISPSPSSNFGDPPTDALDPSSSDLGDETNALDTFDAGGGELDFRKGGKVHAFSNSGRGRYDIGGQVLPDIVSGAGDVAGAFFGDPGSGDQGVSVLSNVDGGRTGGMGVEHQAINALRRGGIAGHYDMGGQITTPQQAQMAGANPMAQQQASQYNNLPMDKLQQLAVSQPQNPMIQKALQMKKMDMSSGSSASTASGVAQSGALGGISPPMAGGGRTHFDSGGSSDSNTQFQDILDMNMLDNLDANDMANGGRAHFDDGGASYGDDSHAMQVLQDVAEGDSPSADNTQGGVSAAPSPKAVGNAPVSQGVSPVSDADLLPPDAKGIAPPAIVTDAPPSAPKSEGELDAKPIVDHSGDTVKLHSEGNVIDTGIPSMKDSGSTSSPWAAVAAAGLGMMAGKSPYALENIGQGGLTGLNFAMEQRQQAGKENQAQAESDLRKQQMQNEQNQFQTKQTTMTPYEQAQIDSKNKELAQAEELKNQSLGLEKTKMQQDQWQIIPDQMGGFLKYNKKTGETQPVAGSSGSMAPTMDPKTGQPLTGDAYLATLSPENAAQIKAMDEGRLNFPAGFALKSPYWQQKLSQLYQYNPDASQQTAAAVKSFNQGKQGDQMRSLNVAVNHLDLLDQLTGALNNGDVKAVNTVGNAWNAQTGSPAPTNFNTAKQIVGDEVTKAVIGAGGTGADRDKAQSVIDAANSPAQLKGAIQTYKQLMTGQLGGLKQQYENSTGRKDFDKYLTPAAKTALMPTSTAPAAATPPDAAIQMLKQNPSLAPAFQQKYGVSPQQYLGQ